MRHAAYLSTHTQTHTRRLDIYSSCAEKSANDLEMSHCRPSVLQKVCKKWAEAVASPGVLYEHLEIDAKGYPAAYRPAAQHDVHAWVRRRIGEATTSAVIANFAVRFA